MNTNVYSHHKDEHERIKTHKEEFSFFSPSKDDFAATIPKQALKESRTADYHRNRIELFKEEIKENQNLLSIINKSYTYDFVQEMRSEHRIEVEKLLLEISRLHDMLEDQERLHKHVLQKMREDAEQAAFLKISNLRQSQVSQIEAIDHQLKKAKEAVEEKEIQLEELEKTTSRKIEALTHENETIKADLKAFIENKNEEMYELKSKYEKQTQESTKKKEEQMDEMKTLADKELKKIQKKLIQKEGEIDELKKDYSDAKDRKSELEHRLEEERVQLQEKLTHIIQTQRQKQIEIVDNLKDFYHTESQEAEKQYLSQRELFQSQIEQLIQVIKMKDAEAQKNMIFRETEKIQFKITKEGLEQQIEELKNRLSSMRKRNLQENQLLKVKMAALHKNDIEQLLKVYETKIENLSRELQASIQECNKAQDQLTEEKKKHYNTKKKYEYTVSRLNEEILVMRTGMSDLEKDMKEKVENEKSMMMLTSRSFIKQAEAKNSSVKFYEEELRKLRQLLEIQAQEIEDSERNVEEKIKMAEEELTRLSNKILEIKGESEESQKKYKAIIEEKEEEIRKLNNLLNAPAEVRQQANENDQIRKLQDLLGEKEDQLRSYKARCEDLESDVRQYRGDIERLHIENQINTEDAKKQYKALSDRNLNQMRAFYERRLKELEEDKRQLGRINSSQTEHITELVKKYKKAEEALRELVKQSKKRGQLETRIISLGMDNNLVKNMAQLFHK